jgi:hypothetical protein
MESSSPSSPDLLDASAVYIVTIGTIVTYFPVVIYEFQSGFNELIVVG